MIIWLLGVFLVLSVLGFVNVNIPGMWVLKTVLLNINGKNITATDLLILIGILALIEALPWPLRGVAGGMLILFILGLLGIITIVWTTQMILVVGVVLLFLAIILGR